MKKIITITIFLFAITGIVFAHGHEEHKKKKKEKTEQVQKDIKSDVQDDIHDHSKIVTGKASMDDFPTLHPLVVHFPIVLLLFAALAQLFSLFIFKEQLSWVTLAMTLVGVAGAFVAGEYVHPHTAELTKQAKWVLEEHESYADYTLWAGVAALLTKILSHFFLKRKIWIEIVVTGCLIGASYFVSQAGHYGSQLTHIEKVEIETDEHSH